MIDNNDNFLLDNDARYQITPEYALFLILKDWGIVEDIDWNFKIYNGIFSDFMKELERLQIVVKEENEDDWC